MASAGDRTVLAYLMVGALLAADRAAWAGLCPACGRNSATVGDGIVFDELNVTPRTRRTPDQPAIETVTLSTRTPNEPVNLTIVGRDVLTAVAASDPNVKFQGKALKGLTIEIAMIDGRRYLLRLDQFTGGSETTDKNRTPITFWASPNTAVEDYEFTVKKIHRKDNADPAPCEIALPERPRAPRPSPPPDDRCLDDVGFKEHLCTGQYLNKDEFWAQDQKDSGIVFEGDYFDPKKTDQPPAGRGYFYLACVGTAAAKMQLLRHTEAGSLSSPLARQTTPAQRTAMLKAITADYCGDGNSWTADGTPLYWTDARGWFPDPDSRKNLVLANAIKGHVEALWGPKGAICLNDPRRKPGPKAACPNATNPTKVPAVQRTDVEKACKRTLPTCGASQIASFTKGEFRLKSSPYVMTVNDPDNKRDYCSQ
jgi:ADYC domain